MIKVINKKNLTKEELKPFIEPVTKKADKLMNYFLIGYFLASLVFAFKYDTFFIAISVSTLCTFAYYLSKKLLPDSDLYQYVLSTILAVYMALFIYQMHGLFEMHFFAFIGSLILITYQNWKLQLPITIVVTIHHGLFAYLQYKGSPVYFTELANMSIETFVIHIILAAVIFGIAGLWAYNSKENTVKDAIKTLELFRMQKELEESTGEELRKLALVASKTNNAVIITNKDGDIEWVNDAYTNISGYTLQESIGKNPAKLLHGELSNKETIKEIGEKLKTKEPFSFEIMHYHKNGNPYWVSVNLTPVLDEHKQVLKTIAIQTDITERKELEEKFISTYSLQKAILDVTSYSIISINPQGIITSFNKGSEKMYGYTAEEVINKISPASFHIPEEVVKRTNELNEEFGLSLSPGLDSFVYKARNGMEDCHEWTMVRKNGEKIKIALTLSALKNNGVITGYVGIAENITEKKLNEEKLRISREEENNRNWVNEGLAKLNAILKIDNDDIKKMSSGFLNFVIKYTGSVQGALYVMKNNGVSELELTAGYALSRDKILAENIKLGEGLVGQVAADHIKKTLLDPPDDYMEISSSLGKAKPKAITIYPAIFENKVLAVMELASLNEYDMRQRLFIEKALDMIALSLDVTERKIKTEKLLAESRLLNQQLQTQEEELRVSNEELTEKSQLLQSSEEELRVQQEELLQTNSQLEEKAYQLEKKNEDIKHKNEQLQLVQEEIKRKADELEQTSKYKSEFLANMSHELRTPLNSILILSNLLSENKNENLSDKQIEYSKVIQKSGTDLLNLINDILDLSKIESGNVELIYENIDLKEFAYGMEMLFSELAISKKIDYKVTVDKNLKHDFISDQMRVEQILKNLLSNAFKFTRNEGKISLEIFNAGKNIDYRKDTLIASECVIGFTVKDSGIGIPEEKQKLIFEAFKQADGAMNRKYGGTGLGLSISKELAGLLGGEIRLSSVQNEGSSFTIYLPVNTQSILTEEKTSNSLEFSPENKTETKKETDSRKKLIVIVEDDSIYSEILRSHAINNGFRTAVSKDGNEGLKSIKELKPDAIILDINLPGISGWEILKKVKDDDELKSIPVHIISASDQKDLSVHLGAADFTKKPFSEVELKHLFENISELSLHEFEKILVIDDNRNQFESIRALFDSEQIICESALTAKEALSKLSDSAYQLIILDLSLPDIKGDDLLIKIKNDQRYSGIPVIIYTGKNLNPEEERELKKYANTVVIKTKTSNSRLTDEVHLFLNKVHNGDIKNELFEQGKKNGITYNVNGSAKPVGSEILKNKKILIVDDDMRNVFALSNLLGEYEMELIIANDGKESLSKLSENPDTAIVLMDIMMPEMDGFEAMEHIRQDKKNKNLPIIALTAKAMKGDREKCILAGASDYIAKPIDTNKLISMLNVWLSK
jgi:PAS domain S-box-containing protein